MAKAETMSSFSVSSSLIFILSYTLLFAVQSSSYPLDNICTKTKNPDFCFLLLGPHSSASLQKLDEVVIDATISNVTATSAKIQSLLSQTQDQNLQAVYSLCSNYYSAAKSALGAAKGQLNSGDYGGMSAAASTVSEDASACQQSFSLAPSQPNALASDNSNLDLLSGVFSVVTSMLSAGSG